MNIKDGPSGNCKPISVGAIFDIANQLQHTSRFIGVHHSDEKKSTFVLVMNINRGSGAQHRSLAIVQIAAPLACHLPNALVHVRTFHSSYLPI